MIRFARPLPAAPPVPVLAQRRNGTSGDRPPFGISLSEGSNYSLNSPAQYQPRHEVGFDTAWRDWNSDFPEPRPRLALLNLAVKQPSTAFLRNLL
jgi:hypothetical protein